MTIDPIDPSPRGGPMPNSVADQIEHLARTRPFALIEESIEELPLPSDEKAALWLLAWSSHPPHTDRTLAHDTLQKLEALSG
jgi:hypothetical protein